MDDDIGDGVWAVYLPCGVGVQPLKYGAKELDRENGLDLYESPPQIITPEDVDMMWNLIPEKK